jgi:hypothetical protein
MATLVETRVPSMGTDCRSLRLATAAALSTDDVLGRLDSTPDGLSRDESGVRLAEAGPNALRSHGARPFTVLMRQLRNPLLLLLVAAALTSFAVGERTGALIILLIIGMGVGLGFINEYRSELAVEALHSQLRHTALVMRDGDPTAVDVTELVPGDVVQLSVGDVVPADLRLLRAEGLECDEAVLTGESLPAEKRTDPITAPESSLDLASCAFMDTVVREGIGLGVVVVTGGRTEFGAIAMRLGERQPQTAFQLGLRDFSLLLVRVTVVLAGSILVINVALGRSLLESVLFALAIAVGLTPQLLPAIVTISLSTGAKRWAERKVVVKRLVSIEDLGNIVVLFTDKTGTLTTQPPSALMPPRPALRTCRTGVHRVSVPRSIEGPGRSTGLPSMGSIRPSVPERSRGKSSPMRSSGRDSWRGKIHRSGLPAAHAPASAEASSRRVRRADCASRLAMALGAGYVSCFASGACGRRRPAERGWSTRRRTPVTARGTVPSW